MKQEIEIIKQMVANGDLPQEVAEKYFPELKESESEDEKIRNEIIDFIYDKTDTRELREKSNSWLTWLEKQKPMEDFNGDDYGIDSLWHAITILEKTLGEVEGYQTDDGILEHKCAITAVRKLAKERREQKPVEWSEEDERNASYICAALDCYYRFREDRNNTNGQEDLDKARNWLYNKLKSLRPQPKQEWSEEDENIRKELLVHCQKLSEASNAIKLADEYAKYNSWVALLKSLKERVQPQNTWKPSDEQMEAMNTLIINIVRNPLLLDNFTQANLKTLYDDLKKLREE